MKTYALWREDGTLRGFEIANLWVPLRIVAAVLNSVEGVESVRWNRSSENRLEFTYRGERCVVHEPFGDNSRYWIGPKEAGVSDLNISALRNAFEQYRNPIVRLLGFGKNVAAG